MAIANIVTLDDFTGRYALSASLVGGEDKFNELVTQEQYDLLLEMIGAALYNIYDTTPTTAEWVALRDGETYTGIDGYVYNWQGMKYLMKPYIFYRWIKSNEFKAVQSGLTKPKFENADSATEYQLKEFTYQRWNQFVDRWKECYNFLWSKNSTDNDYDEFYIWWTPKSKDGIAVKGNIT